MKDYLDNPTLPYQPHSVTSRAAAIRERPFASKKRKAVYLYIREAGPSGRTDNEIIRHFQNEGWSTNTPRARRIELVEAGRVVRVTDGKGEDLKRNNSTVWRAK